MCEQEASIQDSVCVCERERERESNERERERERVLNLEQSGGGRTGAPPESAYVSIRQHTSAYVRSSS